jgi:hypothetical protein
MRKGRCAVGVAELDGGALDAGGVDELAGAFGVAGT